MPRDEEDRERRQRRRRDETSQERRERHEARRERRRTGDLDEKRRSHTSSSEDRRRSAATSKSRSPEKRPKSRSPEKKSTRAVVTEKYTDSSSTGSSNNLSANALAKLNAANEGRSLGDDSDREARKGRSGQRRYRDDEERYKHRDQAIALLEEQRRKKREKPKARVVSSTSNSSIEKGGSSYAMYKEKARRKKWWLIAGFALVVLAIVIPVAVVESRKNMGVSGSSSGGNTPGSTPDTLGGMTQADVPAWAKGTYYDPFTWYDTVDFNTTITNETVGGLPIMGLNSTWDDTVAANDNVPALNKNFTYGTLPIRGINAGGWLSIEPFITPSMFQQFPQSANVVDEYTLTAKLGASLAASQLEKHYSSWINRTSFEQIRDAGFDHVRIPFSYWAITTYDGDPYVKQISWRYLLRGIEYARQCGLRVNLDFHGLPGSQNGWNHSGRQGVIGWLNGTDGALNGQRSLDLHGQLSTFFSQPRYKNVIGIYGLVNEPKMISLPTATVVNWTMSAIDIVRKNGVTALISFADGFLGLPNWKGAFPGETNLVLDAHQYVIFNTDQISYDHTTKLNFACSGWQSQMLQSMNKATGFGPTMCGEWSQADTDCATYLNNVNVGSRWEGTLNLGDKSLNVLSPTCYVKTSQCSCTSANADPSTYSSVYKQWLWNNAVAQMISFESGWGWFYWTWRTESSPQWSWKLGMDAGILPKKVWDRNGTGPNGSPVYVCSGAAPTFSGLPETY